MALTFEKLSGHYIWNTTKEFTAVASTNIVTCAGHGLADGDIIRMYISIGSASGHIPAPLKQYKNYYVKYINANTFYVSLTNGGATIDITDAGSSPGYKFSLYRSTDYKVFTAAVSNIITSATHGLIEGDVIYVDSNATLPAPLVVGTPYYVKYINANTFKLSLTSGGSEIDITTTGTGSHWWHYGQGRYLIKNGSLITNLTRAGKAVMLEQTRLQGGTGDLVSLRLLLLSGSFLNLDECSTADGGFFSMYGTSGSLGYDTILINGTDDTDTTETLDGDIDAVVTTVVCTGASYSFNSLRYIRIDSEWMFIIFSTGSTLTVKRGMFNTTAAAHSTGAAVYVLEEDLPAKIVAEDIAQGWGFCTMDTGKFVNSCRIMFGRPDQTSRTILLTTLDRFNCDYPNFICGGVVYDTIVQSGVGWVEEGAGNYQGLYFNGSNISLGGLSQYENTTLNLFGGSLFLNAYEAYQLFGAVNIMAMSVNSYMPDVAPAFRNMGRCKVYRSWLNNTMLSASSAQLDWSEVWENFKISQSAVTFTDDASDATFRNLSVAEIGFSTGIYGYASGGTKTFIDCDVVEDTTQDGSTMITVHKKSFNVNCSSAEGVEIANVNVKVYDKNGVKVVDALTDVNGNIAEQLITYKYLDVDYTTMIDLNPFKIIVTKAGWYYKDFETDIYTPIVYNFIMENMRND